MPIVLILDNAGMYARFGLPSDTRLWNATFAGMDFRDHYIGSVGSKNCYLRLKYENSSQLMLLVYNDGKDVYSMEDEVIEVLIPQHYSLTLFISA